MKPLHNTLARIVKEQLIDNDITPTVKNCERYITRSVLTKYRISKETPVDIADWKQALFTVKEQHTKNNRLSTDIVFEKLCYKHSQKTLVVDHKDRPPIVSTGT